MKLLFIERIDPFSYKEEHLIDEYLVISKKNKSFHIDICNPKKLVIYKD